MADQRCPATVLLKDDRMGGFVDRCERPIGHQGQHEHRMGATEPEAFLVWSGSHDASATGGSDG